MPLILYKSSFLFLFYTSLVFVLACINFSNSYLACINFVSCSGHPLGIFLRSVRGTLVPRFLLSSIVRHSMPLILYKSSFLFLFFIQVYCCSSLYKLCRFIFGLYKFRFVLRASARNFSPFRSRYLSAAVSPFVNYPAWYAVCYIRRRFSAFIVPDTIRQLCLLRPN